MTHTCTLSIICTFLVLCICITYSLIMPGMVASSDIGTKMLNNCVDVTIIPYYCDEVGNEDGHSSKRFRSHYLELTIQNSLTFSKHVHVGVCNRKDEDTVRTMLSGSCVDRVHVHMLPVSPMQLPLSLCKHMQSQSFDNNIIMYFTEADQATMITRKHVDIVNSYPNLYLSGHRLEEVFKDRNPYNKAQVDAFGTKWILYNGTPKPPCVLLLGDLYYRPSDSFNAYSAAFLCTFETMKTVSFEVIDGMPLESASFSMYKNAQCYKSCDPLGFITIHIGGKEHIAKSIGHDFNISDIYSPL